MFESIDFVAVVVSSLLAIAVGSIWYSPHLFGKAWLRSMGRDSVHVPGGREMIGATMRAIVVQCVFFFALAQFVAAGVVDTLSFSTFGVLAFLLVVTQSMSAAVWEGKTKWYIIINMGYAAITLFGGLAVIAYWPW